MHRRGVGKHPDLPRTESNANEQISKLQVGAQIVGHFGSREPCLLGWMPMGRPITKSNVGYPSDRACPPMSDFVIDRHRRTRTQAE